MGRAKLVVVIDLRIDAKHFESLSGFCDWWDSKLPNSHSRRGVVAATGAGEKEIDLVACQPSWLISEECRIFLMKTARSLVRSGTRNK